jgi:hypothetical protein
MAVTIVDLIAAPELNNRRGKVESFSKEKARYAVRSTRLPKVVNCDCFSAQFDRSLLPQLY